MYNNPVTQRIARLTACWQDAVRDYPEARIFCWMGTVSVEYKMVQAFVAWHISDESDLNDLFLCFKHPFTAATAPGYGRQLISDTEKYIQAWNEDPDLVSQTGYIHWQARQVSISGNNTDARYFAENLATLATQLQVKSGEERLVAALFPQTTEDMTGWAAWLEQVLLAGLPDTVQLMVYDGHQYNALLPLAQKYPRLFRRLQPDMDMFGAMSQILDNIKAGRSDETDKQAVTLQQRLLQLTEAIGQDKAAQVHTYASQAIALCRTHGWPQYEALVHFFVHGWHAANNRLSKALEAIDAAIAKSDEAIEQNYVDNDQTRYHYRIARGNLFFMRKKFEEAAVEYRQCLLYSRVGVSKPMLLGIYQMLGTSLRHSGNKKAAWDYLEEGWLLLSPEDEEMARSNTQLQYYAKEMLDAALPQANLPLYQQHFARLWGNNWQQQLKMDFQTLKITQPA